MPRTKTPSNRDPQPDPPFSVGSLIRIRRREIEISQKELADRLGISPMMVSNYENGTTSIRADDLPKFAQALGVNPAYFYINHVFYPFYDEHGNELETPAEPELIPNGMLRNGSYTDNQLEGLIEAYVQQLTKDGKRRMLRMVQALLQDEQDEMYRAHISGIIKLATQTPDALATQTPDALATQTPDAPPQ